MDSPGVDTRVLDTLDRLASQKAYRPSRGDKSNDIAAIQQALNTLGLRVVADGVLGPQTLAAIRQTQKRLGMRATGMPSVDVARALLSLLQDPERIERFRQSEEAAQSTTDDINSPPGDPPLKGEESVADEEGGHGSVRPQTISDGAVSDIAQDALGFSNYVRGLEQFLKAEETRPPLAIGITARWGQGKTSFMRMLEAELKKNAGQETLSPWEQVKQTFRQFLGIEQGKEDQVSFAGLLSQLKTSYKRAVKKELVASVTGLNRSHLNRIFFLLRWCFSREEEEVKGEADAEHPRFATSWFNPWLYSEPNQLWNAFISNLSSCILNALPLKSRRGFYRKRFLHNFVKQVGFGPRFWIGSVTILLMFLVFFYAIFSGLGGAVMLDIARKFVGPETMQTLENVPWIVSMQLRLFGAAVLVAIFYSQVVHKMDLGLIEYLRKNDYSVKAGALVQFQAEMEMLARAIPENLRVVIFIDDLDRCEKEILMEVISSLQVLTVSSKCFFILGLDLAIVARQIEDSVLAQALEDTDDKLNIFQHGSGFRFLEKVIQARLSVPPYGQEQIVGMVEKLLPKHSEPEEIAEASEQTTGLDEDTLQETPAEQTTDTVESPDDVAPAGPVVDSPEIGEALLKYGPEYFDTPRSLKRFMNSFRLHAHLATLVDNRVTTDQLARYFVLAERWPRVLNYLKDHPEQLDEQGRFAAKAGSSSTSSSIDKTIENLLRGKPGELLSGGSPLGGELVKRLCKWYGFRYYLANSKRKKGAS